jgi:hypothetical protein
MAQAEIWLGVEALHQCRGEARLAEAGFAGNQHDLTVTGLGTRPAPQHQVDLLLSANEPGQRRSTQRLKPAHDDTRP